MCNVCCESRLARVFLKMQNNSVYCEYMRYALVALADFPFFPPFLFFSFFFFFFLFLFFSFLRSTDLRFVSFSRAHEKHSFFPFFRRRHRHPVVESEIVRGHCTRNLLLHVTRVTVSPGKPLSKAGLVHDSFPRSFISGDPLFLGNE